MARRFINGGPFGSRGSRGLPLPDSNRIASRAVLVDGLFAVTAGPTTVQGSVSGAWSVRQTVTGSKAGAWSVRARAQATQSGAWSVRNTVTGSTSGAWSVQVLVTVQSTQSGAWSVRTLAQGSKSGAWSVRANAQAVKSGAWSVRAMVSGDVSGAWSVLSDSETPVLINVYVNRTFAKSSVKVVAPKSLSKRSAATYGTTIRGFR